MSKHASRHAGFLLLACLLSASVVRAKAAMRGHFKTGHMEWPGT
jgi:hypothetical protein